MEVGLRHSSGLLPSRALVASILVPGVPRQTGSPGNSCHIELLHIGFSMRETQDQDVGGSTLEWVGYHVVRVGQTRDA